MVALSGNLIVIPLVGNELELAIGFSRAYDGPGVVALRLRFPDLHLVAAGALGRANKHAAIGILASSEIHIQDKILVTLLGRQVAGWLPARDHQPTHNFPARSAGGHGGEADRGGAGSRIRANLRSRTRLRSGSLALLRGG